MSSIVDISEVLLELGLSASVTEEERAIASVALTHAEGAVKRHLKYDPSQRTRTEYYPQQDFENIGVPSMWEVEGSQAYLRRRSGSSSGELQVRHIPIRSITTLAIDYDGRSGTRSGSFGVDTEKVEGSDFWPNYDGVDGGGNSICRDGIIRISGAWPVSPGSVKIVYVAGYTDAELHGQGGLVDASPIVGVIISEAARRVRSTYLQAKTTTGFTPGPVVSEKLGDYSYRTGGVMADRLFGGLWNLLPESIELLESYVHWGQGI